METIEIDFELIENTPNDMELGALIRSMYNKKRGDNAGEEKVE